MSVKMLPGSVNKKRKLQDEHFGLPSPTKHKFQEQSSDSQQEFPSPEDPEAKLLSKCTVKGKTSLESTNGGSEEHMESVTDSNSFNGESNSDSSLYEDIYELEYSKINSCNQQHPSTSSSSCSSKNVRNTNCFLNRISIKKVRNSVDRKLNPVNLKVALQYEPESRNPELQRLENNEIDQCSDMNLEDMMLDTNEVNLNSYVLSSGRWTIKTDTRFSNKKPTIDKEFEQYFSMLVL